MFFKNIIVCVALWSQFCAGIAQTSLAIQSTSIWLVMDEMQEMVNEVQTIIDDVVQAIDNLAAQEQSLNAIFNQFTQLSTSKVDGVADTVAVLQSLVTEVAAQQMVEQGQLTTMLAEQVDMQSALDNLQAYGPIAEAAYCWLACAVAKIHSQVDMLAQDMAACCADLNSNDGMIMNAIDALNSTLAADIDMIMDVVNECCADLSSNDGTIINMLNDLNDTLAADVDAIVGVVNSCCAQLSNNDGMIMDALTMINSAVIVGVDMIVNAVNGCCTELMNELTVIEAQNNGTQAMINDAVAELSAQNSATQTQITEVLNNQTIIETDIEQVLQAVKQNGMAAEFAFCVMAEAVCAINSTVDQISDDLNACCATLDANDATILTAVVEAAIATGLGLETVNNNLISIGAELNDNDAKIFSVVEEIDTNTTVGLQVINNNLIAIGTELNDNDAKIFSVVEEIDTNTGVGLQVINNNLITLGTELADNDAKIFSVVDQLDTTTTVGLNVINNNLITCCMELNDNDAKIFSAVEQLSTGMAVGLRSLQKTINTQGVSAPDTVRDGRVRLINKSDLNNGCGYIITEPGIYVLPESLVIDGSVGLCINAEQVTLDLNEFTIAVSGDATIPLLIAQSNTVTIKNGIIAGGQGLAVMESTGITIEDLQVIDTINTGINIIGVNSGAIRNCTVRNGAQAGISVDQFSANIVISDSTVCDCQGNGFDLQGSRVSLHNSITQHNGGHGIAVSNGTDTLIAQVSVAANSDNGIAVSESVERIQVESCRVMGNGAVGCIDCGAGHANWLNNLSSGNGVDDYSGIKAVSQAKATSFWHNVYGS